MENGKKGWSGFFIILIILSLFIWAICANRLLNDKSTVDNSVTPPITAQTVARPELNEQQKFFKSALERSDKQKISDLKSLNTLNSVHDGFVGIMEKGRAYYYSNAQYQPPFRFEVMQVLDNEAILAIRNPRVFEQEKCKPMIFLIISRTSYADGVALNDGVYICVGSHAYETVKKDKKTVYCLVEREFLRKNWQYLHFNELL